MGQTGTYAKGTSGAKVVRRGGARGVLDACHCRKDT